MPGLKKGHRSGFSFSFKMAARDKRLVGWLHWLFLLTSLPYAVWLSACGAGARRQPKGGRGGLFLFYFIFLFYRTFVPDLTWFGFLCFVCFMFTFIFSFLAMPITQWQEQWQCQWGFGVLGFVVAYNGAPRVNSSPFFLFSSSQQVQVESQKKPRGS